MSDFIYYKDLDPINLDNIQSILLKTYLWGGCGYPIVFISALSAGVGTLAWTFKTIEERDRVYKKIIERFDQIISE